MIRLFAFTLMALPVFCETITPAERSTALKALDESQQKLRSVTGKLTPEQWTYKPAADRWSIAECVEHIAVTERLILGGMQKALAAPPTPGKFDTGRDAQILTKMANRENRVQAPQEIRPTGLAEYATRDSGLAAFDKIRAQSLEFAETTHADLRAHGFPHPFFGGLDIYQWLLMLSGHATRHTLQIEEVMASPGFPK
jgi:uncharacterized damage-inducible protein DinB